MSDDEKINIGRNARTLESEGTFKGQDLSNGPKRYMHVLFPRLNAEETTGGYGSKNKGVTKEAKDAAVKSFNDKATRSNAGFDPTMLADAAKVAAYHIEAGARAFADFSAKMVEDFGEGIRPYLKDLHTKASEEALGKETAKTSAKDTDHMQAAIKELGPDAKLSDITKRAQELKDAAAKPKFDIVKDADGKPDRLEITHNGEPKGHLKDRRASPRHMDHQRRRSETRRPTPRIRQSSFRANANRSEASGSQGS